MDLAKTLIRTVVRAFYETKHVLVIDALMVHSASVKITPQNSRVAYAEGFPQFGKRGPCPFTRHATEGSSKIVWQIEGGPTSDSVWVYEYL